LKSFEKLHPLLKSFVEKGPAYVPPVTYQGKTVFEDYIGYANLETEKPILPDAIYRFFQTPNW
jgi:hypothetical protein